ncbi:MULTISPECIES: hypothetical protein [unclassified Novosphingobium]|uniref:hypothetical protein n=1 Tax=unclassified Novosphingobium TaxID=2644732 RepID=UPI0006C8C5C6|nr:MULTISPECIES: hypothetical protein [unclassified Novosphingobium]QSR19286.1 hypothetical protein CA833_19085 [Novosphingobium sp. KA1]TCM25130.1 hypothetical protein EDF59_14523 [Novosphingobium sp. ST904]
MYKPFIALAALLSLPCTLQAKDKSERPFQFSVLEDDYQWDNDIEKTRTTLSREIPLGMSFWSALDILEKAGARCAGDRKDPAIARCVYSDWMTVHDFNRADLYWTAVVRLDDGKVGSLTLDRTVEEK